MEEICHSEKSVPRNGYIRTGKGMESLSYCWENFVLVRERKRKRDKGKIKKTRKYIDDTYTQYVNYVSISLYSTLQCTKY